MNHKLAVVAAGSLALIGIGAGWMWHPGAGLMIVGLLAWVAMERMKG